MAHSGEKKSIRSRVLGAAALGILALGIWLGSLLKGPGLGTGEGGTPAQTGDGQTDLQNTTVSLGHAETQLDTIVDADSSSTPAPGNQQRLAIMIYGNGYRLPGDGGTGIPEGTGPLSERFTDANLDDVVHRAAQTVGNRDGKRVLLLYHKTSTIEARNRLMTALKEAGLKIGEVDRRTGYVD